jgi:DNA-binding transcriptional MerR regulator
VKGNYFKIGEVSKIKGITIRALRFYERIGLIKPSYIDPASRYRYYHISQFVYLDIIKAARMMDISPNALIPYFNTKDSEGLVSFLDMHKEIIRQKIRSFEDIVRGIDEVKKSLYNAKMTGNNDEVYFKQMADRYVATIPFRKNKSSNDYVIDYAELYLIVNKYGFINTYMEGVLFSKNDRNEFHPESLCNFVTGVKDEHYCRLIPGGNYICVCYTKENAAQQQNKLWDYLQKHDLNPTNLIQVDLLTDLLAEETKLIELQARV